MQKQYDNNKSYQRPPQPLHDKVLEDLHDPDKFKKYLADERYYHDYLVYFRGEIDRKGYQSVINEYLFAGDERADDMLARMYAGKSVLHFLCFCGRKLNFVGFLHPIIHLGFGVEFHQPVIVAEALAQAAAHDNWISIFLQGAKKAAASSSDSTSLVVLLDEIRANQKLSTAAHWGDGNKIRDGILARAPNEMIKYASQFNVKEQELEAKTAEMTNAASKCNNARHPLGGY